MRMRVANLSIMVMLIGIICTSCGAAKTKAVNGSNKNTNTANVSLNQNAKDAVKDIEITKKEAWEKFIVDSQKTIKETEYQIEDLRSEIPKTNIDDQQEFIKTLDNIEQKNNSLKARLVKVNKRIKSNIEDINRTQEVAIIAFEKAFVQDLDELLRGLRNFIKINNNI